MSDEPKLSTIPPVPDERLIKLLSNLLEMAEKGDIMEVAITGLYDDRVPFNCYYSPNYPNTLLGGLRVLENELIENCIGTRLHEAGARVIEY